MPPRPTGTPVEPTPPTGVPRQPTRPTGIPVDPTPRAETANAWTDEQWIAFTRHYLAAHAEGRLRGDRAHWLMTPQDRWALRALRGWVDPKSKDWLGPARMPAAIRQRLEDNGLLPAGTAVFARYYTHRYEYSSAAYAAAGKAHLARYSAPPPPTATAAQPSPADRPRDKSARAPAPHGHGPAEAGESSRQGGDGPAQAGRGAVPAGESSRQGGQGSRPDSRGPTNISIQGTVVYPRTVSHAWNSENGIRRVERQSMSIDIRDRLERPHLHDIDDHQLRTWIAAGWQPRNVPPDSDFALRYDWAKNTMQVPAQPDRPETFVPSPHRPTTYVTLGTPDAPPPYQQTRPPTPRLPQPRDADNQPLTLPAYAFNAPTGQQNPESTQGTPPDYPRRQPPALTAPTPTSTFQVDQAANLQSPQHGAAGSATVAPSSAPSRPTSPASLPRPGTARSGRT
ncbi:MULTISPECIES: hypothetical protein [Micromonospora]|uniref:Uncharacterized protein n=1 Tax=Micromonospora yangpuensis TaxID=683228 RepID=A0A1C6U5A5_9ACTN|nr:hypothetical protein [Micromonospora yangpuensis]GGL91845.1 hypothetical protein GCM10012279_06970 [Micromonospora yangpuensis]SCL49236.1 hypothetical protein GA0070617_1119 [Micromonospora yangpuensis]